MAQPNQREYSLQEYFWEEQRSEVKRDFYNGQVYALAGGSPDHSRIATNLIAELSLALRGKDCEAFNSDLRIGVTTLSNPINTGRRKRQSDEDFVTYPDVSVVCGKLEYYKGDHYTIANPSVIFEVLSPSTRNYDRSFKLEHYQKIASLQAYVMIDSEQVRIEYYTKVDQDQWLQRTLTELEDTIKLEAPPVNISVKELYARVEFGAEEE